MKFEWEWLIGCTTAVIMTLSIVSAIYFGTTNTNEKYYASMDKCTSSGGSFIPQSQGSAICLMGVKQQ